MRINKENKNLGNKFRELLELKNIKQTAEMLGVTSKVLTALNTGTAGPSLQNIFELIYFLLENAGQKKKWLKEFNNEENNKRKLGDELQSLTRRVTLSETADVLGTSASVLVKMNRGSSLRQALKLVGFILKKFSVKKRIDILKKYEISKLDKKNTTMT